MDNAICLFVYLFGCLFICLVVCLVVCLFIWLFGCLVVCLFVTVIKEVQAGCRLPQPDGCLDGIYCRAMTVC